VIVIRIDPQTNTVTWDEPTSDTMVFHGRTFRECVAQAEEAIRTWGQIMDENGTVNFDLSKE
jgi:hypothetical protein